MHSFVFALEKKDRVEADMLGLLSQSGEEVLTEKKIAQLKTKAFEKLGRSLDIDAHLESNNELLNLFADNMMDLLSKCGYDVSDYKEIMCTKFGYQF
jgi:ATP phosphoribosyltransferase